jgi:integrase/recombinase XerD
MGLSKQAKTLNKQQIEMISSHLRQHRNGLRNQTIFLLSVRSGLRAKEIAGLKWRELLTPEGLVGDTIELTDETSKGKSGRSIPLHPSIKKNLIQILKDQMRHRNFDPTTSHIVRTERATSTTAQTIVSMFHRWYKVLGLLGCSSHSGRRTFITETAKKISLVGGSLRDIQMLAGHKSLQTTQRYIESDSEAQTRVVSLL